MGLRVVMRWGGRDDGLEVGETDEKLESSEAIVPRCKSKSSKFMLCILGAVPDIFIVLMHSLRSQ